MNKYEAFKISADTATGVTIGAVNVPDNPEVGSLVVTIITILARVLVERLIEKRKRKTDKV